MRILDAPRRSVARRGTIVAISACVLLATAPASVAAQRVVCLQDSTTRAPSYCKFKTKTHQQPVELRVDDGTGQPVPHALASLQARYGSVDTHATSSTHGVVKVKWMGDPSAGPDTIDVIVTIGDRSLRRGLIVSADVEEKIERIRPLLSALSTPIGPR